MGFLDFLGKGLDLVTDFIPGGNIVQSAVELVVPKAKSFFEGSLDAPQQLTGGSMVPTYSGLPALPTGGSAGMSIPEAVANEFPLATMASNIARNFNTGYNAPAAPSNLPPATLGNVEQLSKAMPAILDSSHLRTYYRAPKGYVVVKLADGNIVCMDKKVARFYGLYKPSAKPPISARDWKNYKRNKAIEKKISKVAAPIIREARSKARASATKRKKR